MSINDIKNIENVLLGKIKDLINETTIEIDSATTFDQINEFVSMIKNNPKVLCDETIERRVVELLNSLNDSNLLEDALSEISILKIILKNPYSMNESINIDRNSFRIQKIIDIIKKVKPKDNINLSLKLQSLQKLYDKLIKGENGKEFLSEDEFELINSIIKDESFNFKKSVLNYILILSNKIMDADYELFDTEEQENSILIDEDVLIELFKRYNINYDVFSNEQKEKMRKYFKLDRVEEILNFLINHEEFKFLIDLEEGPDEIINKEIKKNVKKLFNVLRFSSVSILEYLLNDSINRDVDLKKIFKIKGVYKRVRRNKERVSNDGGNGPRNDSLDETGSYEYYVAVSNILDDLSKQYSDKFGINVNFYNQAIERCMVIFENPPELIKQNINLYKVYGINFINRIGNSFYLKSPSTLLTRNFAINSDRLIEMDCYSYLKTYPSVLKEDCTIDKMVYEYRNGTLEFDRNGRLVELRKKRGLPSDFDSVVSRDYLFKLIKGFNLSNEFEELAEFLYNSYDNYYDYNGSLSIIDYSNDKFIQYLDNNCLNDDKVSYNIKGLNISVNKVKRMWFKLEEYYKKNIEGTDASETFNYKELMFYVLSYNSYLSADKIMLIQIFVDQLNFGGRSL